MAHGRRPHKPHQLGPRVYQREEGGNFYIDLRPWDGGRFLIRDPSHPRWPDMGDTTRFQDVAEQWKWKYVEQIEAREWTAQTGRGQESPALELAVEKFLTWGEKNRERQTVVGYTVTTNHLRDFLGEDRRLGAITAKDLQEFFDEFAEEGYAWSTRNQYRTNLSAFLSFFKLDFLLDDVDIGQGSVADATAWTDAQVEALREAADERGGEAPKALDLAFATGARKHELFALRWEDFRPATKTVRISRQVLPARATDTKPLKGKRSRTALVFPEWWEWHEEGARGLILDVGIDDRGTMFREIREGAGVGSKGDGWHTCRHTYARRYLESGGQPYELQHFLGHTSIDTTTETYGHFSTEAAVRLGSEVLYGA